MEEKLKCMSLFTLRHKKDFTEVLCTPTSKGAPSVQQHFM